MQKDGIQMETVSIWLLGSAAQNTGCSESLSVVSVATWGLAAPARLVLKKQETLPADKGRLPERVAIPFKSVRRVAAYL